jgi:hypothetical protein
VQNKVANVSLMCQLANGIPKMNPTNDKRSSNRPQPKLNFYEIPNDSDSEYPEEDWEDQEEESCFETEDDEDEALEEFVYWEREREKEKRLRLLRDPEFKTLRVCLSWVCSSSGCAVCFHLCSATLDYLVKVFQP